MTTNVTPRETKFLAHNDDVTARVVAEFNDTGIPTAVAATTFGRLGVEEEQPEQPAAQPAPADEIKKMLDSADDWTIAVPSGAAPVLYVFTKGALEKALQEQNDPAVVSGRLASASERLLHETAPKLLGPEAALDRVKGALGLPVAQAALVGAAAGLFGLGALKDAIARPWLVSLAVALTLLAIVLSLVGTHALKTVMFVPARLDLVRARYESMVSGPVKASNRGLALLVVAAVAALFAVWPAATAEQKGSIDTTVQRAAAGFTAVVAASWRGLDADVATVETTVAQEGRPLGSARSSPKADGTVAHQLQIVVTAADDVDIETRALDAEGTTVGNAVTDTVVVPSG
jgi:hypothetical protein